MYNYTHEIRFPCENDYHLYKLVIFMYAHLQ